MIGRLHIAIQLIIFLGAPAYVDAGDSIPDKAKNALRKATQFFRNKVATQGSYLWVYGEDLKQREGEGRATATQGWVQPPGTPSVGLAFLNGYDATKDRFYLEAAKKTAAALVSCQLHSGGWDYRLEFDPKQRRRYAYRVDSANPKGRNTTTLDDNTTQEAIRFLMRLDKTLQFKDKAIHESVRYALSSLLIAQYPNGAWPQRFDRPPEAKDYPIKKAGYPQSWSRKYPGKDYRGYYTLNDNSHADMIDVMQEAAEIYQNTGYAKAVAKAGDFLLLAQLPDPQPGWAQQYDKDMHPAWARKFEPAAVTGGEARGAMRTLLRLYTATGDKKYLAPIPRALEFYRSVRLPGRRLARFYELKTSKPLYFTKDYQLTYSDADMPTHYAFKVSDWTEQIAREYDRARKLEFTKKQPRGKSRSGPPSRSLIANTQRVIAALDSKGRWLETGRLRHHGNEPTKIISCRTFVQNVNVLSAYLTAVQNK